jgi:cytochrome c oxidase cbb3-type subunit 4
MDPGVLRGIGTLVLMMSFVALCVWAYSPRRKDRFDRAARLPLADDDVGGER